MTAWIIRVLSALLAAAMLPASPAPSAPKAEEQPVGSQQVQQAAAMTETQAPPAIRQTEPEAEKEDAASNAAAPLPEPAQPQDEETGSETPADKPSLSDLSPQFWEIVGLTLNGKLMSSQNPTLIAFAQPFYQWLSDNDYFDINIVYDEDRNVFRDDGQRGIVAIGFDYDATQGIYFSAHEPWMRKPGYCE